MSTVVQSPFLVISCIGALALAGIVGACSSSCGGNPSTGNDAGSGSDGGSSSGSSSGMSSSGSSGGASSSGSSSGSASSSGSSSGVAEGGTDGGACTTLTIYNFDSWCTVSISGGATSVKASYTACVPSGGSVVVAVGPASGSFEVGPDPWVSITSGDAGVLVSVADAGPDESLVNINVGSTPVCALLCCPFTNGTGCANQPSSGYSTFLTDCN
jgi:hypothetical protein